jgi:Uma2 family endonuclease
MILKLSKPLTAARFAKEYEDVPLCELERGEVVFLTAAGWDHSRIVTQIACALARWASRTRLGRVLTGEAGLVTQHDPDTVRGIDVVFISYKRVPRGKGPSGFLRTPPELAVEVVGKGQGWTKMLEKASEYLELGVDRVWIVDPGARTVNVFRPDGDPLRLTTRETIRDRAILPGFSCRVAAFFED